jgi:hypothetical protein
MNTPLEDEGVEDNIKMYLKIIGCESVNLIMTHNKPRVRIKCSFEHGNKRLLFIKVGNLLTSSATTSFLRLTHFHGIRCRGVCFVYFLRPYAALCSLIAYSSGIIQSNNVNHRLCYSPSITGVPCSGYGTTVCCPLFRNCWGGRETKTQCHRLISTNLRLPSTAYQLTSSCVSMDLHRHSDDGRAVVLELKIVHTSRWFAVFRRSIIERRAPSSGFSCFWRSWLSSSSFFCYCVVSAQGVLCTRNPSKSLWVDVSIWEATL